MLLFQILKQIVQTCLHLGKKIAFPFETWKLPMFRTIYQIGPLTVNFLCNGHFVYFNTLCIWEPVWSGRKSHKFWLATRQGEFIFQRAMIHGVNFTRLYCEEDEGSSWCTRSNTAFWQAQLDNWWRKCFVPSLNQLVQAHNDHTNYLRIGFHKKYCFVVAFKSAVEFSLA